MIEALRLPLFIGLFGILRAQICRPAEVHMFPNYKYFYRPVSSFRTLWASVGAMTRSS